MFHRKDFTYYAETCFQQFGDRVKKWVTFNEPHTLTVQGYDVGLQAPGRCSIVLGLFCRAGNSATEPYIVAHHVLLSHAAVADVYRKKYKVWAINVMSYIGYERKFLVLCIGMGLSQSS